MVVLHKITPSIRTPVKFAPVRSAPLKFVGGILALVSLFAVLASPYSYPNQKKGTATIIVSKTNFLYYSLVASP